ncbi:uncharacterized protein LOC135158075 isoform X2 [Lytechinus pictus]|uniref:uncharacterized protein LOC135158075 isoform X2 n=1 Tax=Lytechinus pictus TaxID=7653 RepID=UPI0030B9F964
MPLEVDCSTDLEDGELSYQQKNVQSANFASLDLTVNHQPSTSGASNQQQNVPSSLTDLTPSTSGTRGTSIPPILPRKITKPTGPGSTLQPTNPSRNTGTRPSAKRSLHYLEQLEPNTKKKSLSPAQEVMIELAREEHAWLKREHELRVEILQLEIQTAQYKEEEARRSLNKVNANLNSDP